MCLPPVNRIQRAAPLQHVQPIAKQQQQQQAEQQQPQQELQLDTGPLPELFLKTDFQPELLMPELLSPSSCVSSISAPASSPSSAAGSASSSATSPLQQVPALAEVDLSWLDQDLLTSLEPLPLVEEQQSFQPQQTLLPAAATLTFEPSLHLDLVGDDEDEDDDMDEMDGQTTTFLPRHLADDDEEDDEDDNEEFHILSPDSNSTSGSDSKAAARKTKNRKRKLACDLSADELAKTREINRIAAQRHRQAAKAKRVERQRRFDDMGKRNEILREQVRDMSAELKTLRRLIVDMYSPNGSRHLQLMAPSTPIDFSFLGLA